MARLMNPVAMNIFEMPFRFIQGVIAKGMPILTALRRNVIPVNASPVI